MRLSVCSQRGVVAWDFFLPVLFLRLFSVIGFARFLCLVSTTRAVCFWSAVLLSILMYLLLLSYHTKWYHIIVLKLRFCLVLVSVSTDQP